jgi:ArsR family transcriptional regulator, arsenate/arsenite/antimonite-responsive transcriptional repressor
MDEGQFQRIAKALADPRRFAILEQIARHKRDLACQVLVKQFAVTQATISHHLRELQFAGLVECRRDGKCFHFSANRIAIKGYVKELARRLAPVKTSAVE